MTDANYIDATDVYDPDEPAKPVQAPQPLYQIYRDSKVAVSKQVGKYWKNHYDAAVKAYEEVRNIWEEVYKYYNFHHGGALQTPIGVFRRGDGTENVIFSNINIMLPAVYSRDPDVSITTGDKEDEPFADCLEAVLNAIFKRKHLLNAKPKIKKAAGVALLTNFGVLKIDWTRKDDSLELAAQEMQEVTNKLKNAKDQQEVEDLYGRLEALESNMEVLKPSGPSVSTILPHNLIIDPYAEQPDGLDASWMDERVFIPTSFLAARYTQEEEEDERTDEERSKDPKRVLIYKPTHKAVFTEGVQGQRDDGLGMVMRALSGAGDVPTSFEAEGRQAYVNMYFTECHYLWDKKLRRVYLFHADDWTWPLWVWDNPLNITRFFPYFIMSFSMSTGGTVSAGEVAYYLDQQDEINDINRQLATIRRSVFDFFYYNSDTIEPDDAEKFIDAIRGKAPRGKRILGVKAGEGGKITDNIQAFAPPSLQYEMLFDKPKIIETINRISNTSDALRGTQFKTNTNVASVQSYQESMRLSVGAKVDVIEDTVADMANAFGELAVQNYSQEDVTELVGAGLAESWEQLDLATFTAKYSINVIAGSMEKPNSVFKKKEAIEISQAVGQFARAAPGSVSKIMLRVLEQAFTEVVIKKEDWDSIDQEIMATMQKGVSAPEGGGQAEQILQQARQLPEKDKQEVMRMSEEGADPGSILQFIQRKTGASNAP